MQKIIKNNSLINKIFFHIGSFLIRVIGIFVPVNDKKILFSSGIGVGIFDSPLVIYEAVKKDEHFNDYEMVWAVKNPKNFPDYKTVKLDTFKYFITCLSSKVWITSVNIERGLKFKKKSTIYINTWHGVPFKHIGLDVKARNDYNFSHVDYFITSGKYEEPIYMGAFNLSKNQIKCVGNPRNITLYQERNIIDKEAFLLKNQIDIPVDKKVILYAPTWKDYDYRKIKLDLIASNLPEEYVIFVKSHPLEKLDFTGNNITDVSHVSDIADILPFTDILMSDYSSVMVDYSILRRPIISYAPDYEAYAEHRGVYVLKDELAPNVFDHSIDISNFINSIDYEIESLKTAEYSEKFLQADPRVGLEKIIQFIKESL